MRALVTTCVQITLIGSMVVILLLAAQLITNIGNLNNIRINSMINNYYNLNIILIYLAQASTGLCFCTWIMILAAILTPLTW